MKYCPQCRRPYDNSLNFCLQDGNPLVSDGSMAYDQGADTLVLPESRQSSILKMTDILNDLRTEILNNLGRLNDVLQQMYERAPSEYFGTSVYKQIDLENLANISIPSWQDNVWQAVYRGILNRKLLALLTESEFAKVKNFYDELKTFTEGYIKQNPREAEISIRRLLNNSHPLL